MQTAQEMRAHYRAVSARLTANRVTVKVLAAPRPELPPAPLPAPPATVHFPKMLAANDERDILHVATPATCGTLEQAKPSPRAIAEKIVRDVCAARRMSVEQALSVRREAAYIDARAEIAWSLREQCHWSYPKIGQFLGRDHSTVIWAVKKHQAKLDAVTP